MNDPGSFTCNIDDADSAHSTLSWSSVAGTTVDMTVYWQHITPYVEGLHIGAGGCVFGGNINKAIESNISEGSKSMEDQWCVYRVVFIHNITREISETLIDAKSSTLAIAKAIQKAGITFDEVDDYTIDAEDLFIVPAPKKAKNERG